MRRELKVALAFEVESERQDDGDAIEFLRSSQPHTQGELDTSGVSDVDSPLIRTIRGSSAAGRTDFR
jgi:hypothetical protein